MNRTVPIPQSARKKFQQGINLLLEAATELLIQWIIERTRESNNEEKF